SGMIPIRLFVLARFLEQLEKAEAPEVDASEASESVIRWKDCRMSLQIKQCLRSAIRTLGAITTGCMSGYQMTGHGERSARFACCGLWTPIGVSPGAIFMS